MYLELDGWELGLRFSSAHFIPYHGKCERLHGHDYSIKVKLYGSLDESGMVMDFTHIKRALKEITSSLDHRLLLPESFVVSEDDESVHVEVHSKKYMFPKSDVLLLDVETPTVESLAKFTLSTFISMGTIPDSVYKVELCVEEGRGQGAWDVWEKKKP